MFIVYFNPDFPIFSLQIRAFDFADVIIKIAYLLGDEVAYHKISEIHTLKTL